MRAEVDSVAVVDTAERLAALAAAADDVRAAGSVAQLTTADGDAFAVTVVLPDADA